MLSPRTVKQELAGQSFHVHDVGSKRDVRFSFPDTFTAWPRRGLEGIVMPVTCHHPALGDIPSILKCFDHLIPQRTARQAHLVHLRLASRHAWLYQGVPYCWIDKRVAGHRVYGHVARYASKGDGGEDFRIVRDDGSFDRYTGDDRRELAAQLCIATGGLEKLDLVHGDLSPANIVISRSEAGARCVPIDYDGFFSGAVPHLPRRFEALPSRPLGSPGYQHPVLMRRIAEDADGTDDSVRVANDRFALAVLCVELMTWTSELGESLERAELLDLEYLARHVMRAPTAVAASWPEGYALLERAVAERDLDALPGPEEWLSALGFDFGPDPGSTPDERDLGACDLGDLGARDRDSDDPDPAGRDSGKHPDTPWHALATLEIGMRSGNALPVPLREIVFGNDGENRGTFELVDPRLAAIGYAYSVAHGTCSSMRITFGWNHPVVRRRAGRSEILDAQGTSIDVVPGDILMSNGWELAFGDTGPATHPRKS